MLTDKSLLMKSYECMKGLCLKLLLILLMSGNSLHSDEQDINQLFLNTEEIESHIDSDIQSYFQVDPGHPKSFLFLKNFPARKKIICSIRRLAQEDRSYTKHAEFFLDEQGALASTIDSKGDWPFFCVSSRGFLPGERISCRFTTEKGDFKRKISFIPNPITARNKSGTALVEAELTVLVPAFYQFSFIGFQEDEAIRFLSISGDEKLRIPLKISKGLVFTNSPDVLARLGGIGKVIFTRESGDQIQIDLPWGNDLFDYSKGNKIYKPN